jgi:outer membrane protein OmpA-like peptidoglycan-associated protein
MIGSLRRPIVLILVALALAACGGGSSSSSSGTTAPETTTTTAGDTTTTTAADDTTTTTAGLPPGQTAGPFDLNDDGNPDPMCGQQDFGGGLVLQVFCDAEGYGGEVPQGVTLTDTSLFHFPTTDQISMDGISGDLVQAADPANKVLYIIVFRSDATFESGGSTITATETFDNVVALINGSFPGATLQLRGHTDSTGDPASNQSLSEARANSVEDYLKSHGVQAGDITTIGFGETQPLALDDTDEGKAFNRRVELVIRPAA